MPKVNSLADITAQISTPAPIRLGTDVVSRGVDNYHVDVQISQSFTLRVRETLEQNLKLLMSGKPIMSSNSETMHALRSAYADLMQTTIHRTKTDFSSGQVQVLQFGIVKFAILEVRDVVERQHDSLEATLSQQQNSGSRALLATQERLTWFRAHSGEFIHRLVRLLLRCMVREENNQLRALRQQFLGDFPEAVNIMFNPMLYSRSPKEPLLMLDYYAVWPGDGAGFERMNEVFEELFKNHFPDKPVVPLKTERKTGHQQSEVYDSLGGLFASQPTLGPAENQYDRISEEFCWLDHSGNMRLLFDPRVHEQHLAQEGLGFTGTRRLKADLKALRKIAAELRRAVGDEKAVCRVLASYALKEKLQQTDLDAVAIEDALAVVAGRDVKKVAKLVDATMEGAAVLQAKLENCVRDFDRMMRESNDELFVRFLADYSRYRLHLKYYRFAHRMFNRVSVITRPEEIQLARAGGHLYQLLSSDEARDADIDNKQEIVHHCVLKADVRGSTTVTRELTKQGLNPASYFSLRFFNPITERLATYGAVKVFIEGDAVILSVYEYNNAPDQWFSVSRCCGIAKEMLEIVSLKNAHAGQTGLPVLELGIGICYQDDRPMFLFDEDKPIMISSAIGNADRMSSCSWRLRESIVPGRFNVGVYLLDDEDSQKGEKGQDMIRYNVNGIVIDDAAFAKLQEEVHFTQVTAKSDDSEEDFFVGQYPDVFGKLRDLVVRQGKVGIWSGDRSVRGARTGKFFYEVLPNSRFASQIVGLAHSA